MPIICLFSSGDSLPSLAGRLFAAGVDSLTILVLSAHKEANERSRRGLFDHSLDLPDHAAFADTRIRKGRAPACRIVEKVVIAMPGQGIGRGSQCPLCVEFQKK